MEEVSKIYPFLLVSGDYAVLIDEGCRKIHDEEYYVDIDSSPIRNSRFSRVHGHPNGVDLKSSEYRNLRNVVAATSFPPGPAGASGKPNHTIPIFPLTKTMFIGIVKAVEAICTKDSISIIREIYWEEGERRIHKF